MTTLDRVLIFNSIISLGAHAYTFMRWSESHLAKQLRKERNRIIKHHVKSGHKGHPLHCIDQICFKLRTPAAQHPQVQPEPHTD